MCGFAIGLGAAAIDVLYAGLGLAGVGKLLDIPVLRTALGLAGAVVMAYPGFRSVASSSWVRPRVPGHRLTERRGRSRARPDSAGEIQREGVMPAHAHRPDQRTPVRRECDGGRSFGAEQEGRDSRPSCLMFLWGGLL
ncbi:hypothetical protein PV963_36440 [Streptomyces coeruleorubidus]|uniref:LysE family transporter n=1 Tax=Streptomyces coeruleorubidus TaxID=116188 RepID=UPI00237FBE3F|nr:LysE family transporter [Streptomyces coeruleorubidus]WDV55457.1 hypothetical protein PV963_36440 [Streptomyces coeruleorubidus]